jgi:hydrogenase maturation factor
MNETKKGMKMNTIKTTTETGTNIELEISINNIRVTVPNKNITAWGEWGEKDGREGIIFEIKSNGRTQSICAVLNIEIKAQIDALRADMIETRNQIQREKMVPAIIFEGLGLTDIKLGFVIDTGDASVQNSNSNFFIIADSEETIDITAIKRDARFRKILNDKDRVGEFSYIESAIYVISEEEGNEILNILEGGIEEAHEEVIVQNEACKEKIRQAKRTAEATGEAVWFENRGVTDKCMNEEEGCSFDSIDIFVLPDGSFETRFICCY